MENIFVQIAISIAVIAIIILLIRLLSNKLLENENLKYEFITIIAHKFRTPLTKIKWSLNELLPSEQDHYKKEFLDHIEESNEDLIKLTSTLIELTDSYSKQKATYALEKLSLFNVVKETSDIFKNKFHEKNIFFSAKCDNDSIVNINKSGISFVVQVLLENALNYTPTGRNVDISIDKVGKKAILIVKDTGIGITHKDIGHIFSKFYRATNATTNDSEGLGIGLFLAKSIISRHKGKMEVHSDGEDLGCTFKILLPIAN